ncbi:MAG: tRNA (5-methylaminomethyl-2-thiouridine)(34)-methyltransferase MnmD [Bacteroidetes bacterium]|nr:tRNA (5-methylaminomethyl-2-thiouridine)(34)-methyltransferase MnmD [Bacteroidota bacterium]
MRREVVLTLDGSHTIYVPELDEHYHSTGGAINESEHVFIRAGFDYCRKSVVTVFEAGFGTGLNALLTALRSREMNRKTEFVTIEKYPLPAAVSGSLNFPEQAGKGAAGLFTAIHRASWNRKVVIDKHFVLHKIEGDLVDNIPDCRADVIYYDAFAPSKQPEMWNSDLLRRVVALLEPGGIFVTYSARGEVRRTLKSAGLQIDLLRGAAGKRHMLRAVKI